MSAPVKNIRQLHIMNILYNKRMNNFGMIARIYSRYKMVLRNEFGTSSGNRKLFGKKREFRNHVGRASVSEVMISLLKNCRFIIFMINEDVLNEKILARMCSCKIKRFGIEGFGITSGELRYPKS